MSLLFHFIQAYANTKQRTTIYWVYHNSYIIICVKSDLKLKERQCRLSGLSMILNQSVTHTHTDSFIGCHSLWVSCSVVDTVESWLSWVVVGKPVEWSIQIDSQWLSQSLVLLLLTLHKLLSYWGHKVEYLRRDMVPWSWNSIFISSINLKPRELQLSSSCSTNP